MDVKFCPECGEKLQLKVDGREGLMPFCARCGQFRYPVFSTAVSMVVMNEKRDKVILIKQYGRPFYVLVAGYVNKGEEAENAVIREVKEEMGLTVTSMRFNRSRYFLPSETLMLSFLVTVADDIPTPNEEIDEWAWFSLEEAEKSIKDNSLASEFLDECLRIASEKK